MKKLRALLHHKLTEKHSKGEVMIMHHKTWRKQSQRIWATLLCTLMIFHALPMTMNTTDLFARAETAATEALSFEEAPQEALQETSQEELPETTPPSPPAPEEVAPVASFYNWDDHKTPLYEIAVAAGGYAVYEGETPKCPGFEFIGWKPDPTDTPMLADTQFVAQFRMRMDEPAGSGNVIASFYNWDNHQAPLYEVAIEIGGYAAYEGETPRCAGFEFVGWNPDPADTPMLADTQFIARFRMPVDESCLVEYIDHDGSAIEVQSVLAGTASVAPQVPVRLDTNDSAYWFVGWQSIPAGMTPANITGDVVFRGGLYRAGVHSGDGSTPEVRGRKGRVLAGNRGCDAL